MRRVMPRIWASALLAMSTAVLAAPGGEPTHEFSTTSDGVKIHYMQFGLRTAVTLSRVASLGQRHAESPD